MVLAYWPAFAPWAHGSKHFSEKASRHQGTEWIGLEKGRCPCTWPVQGENGNCGLPTPHAGSLHLPPALAPLLCLQAAALPDSGVASPE